MTQVPDERQGTEDKKLFAGLGVIGVIAALLGVWVLLIQNWFTTPDWLKILFGGAVLGGALFGAARTSLLPERWPRDLFLLFHSGALLMMTWIIAEVYNVHTNPWRAFAFCALLSLPGALSGELSILGDVVIVFALTALFAFIGDHPSLHPLVEGYGFSFFIAIVALWLFRWSRQFLQQNNGMKIALQRWGWILGFIALIASIYGFGKHGTPMSRSDFWLMLAYLGGVIFWSEGAFGVMKENRRRLFWLGALLLPLSALAPSILGDWLRLLLGFVLTAWFLVLLVQSCLEDRDPTGARWALGFLALRVFIFYGEILGEDAASGWWLIFIGVTLASIAYGWSRLQPMIAAAEPVPQEAPTSSAPSDQGFLFTSLGVVELALFFFWIIILELR
jgi:Predicted membrane protein (DUF2157)